MHIGIAGPMDLGLLQGRLDSQVLSRGYPFPMTSLLALEHLRRGHEVTAFTTDRSAAKTYELSGRDLTVIVHPMRPRARDRAADLFRVERRALTKSMRDVRPDVLHAHWTYEFALAALACGLPNVVTVHDWAPSILRHHRDAYRAVRLVMQAATLARAHQLTAVSPYLAKPVHRYYRRSATLVPNGLPESHFIARSARHVNPEGSRLGCLNASIDRLKNVRLMLRAFQIARHRSRRDLSLVLGGPGYELNGGMHRWAVQNDLHIGVEFRGPVQSDKVSDFMDGIDIFVHPSLEESFGMVLLEAMARAVPVIAGDRSGAVPWLLNEGAAGLLVDVSRADAIAAGIVKLTDNEEWRTSLAFAGHGRARQFTMPWVAERYEVEYGYAVGGHVASS
jgi:L-malate glycosyltransferase